jgi:hypothetical protein
VDKQVAAARAAQQEQAIGVVEEVDEIVRDQFVTTKELHIPPSPGWCPSKSATLPRVTTISSQVRLEC